jgi:hypothetical protein
MDARTDNEFARPISLRFLGDPEELYSGGSKRSYPVCVHLLVDLHDLGEFEVGLFLASKSRPSMVKIAIKIMSRRIFLSSSSRSSPLSFSLSLSDVNERSFFYVIETITTM